MHFQIFSFDCKFQPPFQSDQIGIIHTKWRPADAIISISEKLRREFQNEFSKTIPRLELNGHTEESFAYIPEPGFDTIMEELLRNSFRHEILHLTLIR